MIPSQRMKSGRKRISHVLLWGVLVTAGVSLGWLVYKGLVPIKVRAASTVYTVVRTEKGFDKVGNLRYTNEYVDSVRGDGSMMLKTSTAVDRRRRIGFANGAGVVINELIGKKSTYPKNFSALRVKRDPDTSCSSEVDSKVGIAAEGTDYVGGYRTVRFGSVNEEGAWKVWYAPEVGCALVQMRLEHREGVTIQQLASLSRGEPDPSLFQVPANLEETPPSGLYVPICRDGKCDTIPDSVKARLDKKYYEARSQVP